MTVHVVASWLLVIGFLGAGVANLLGAPATQRSFVRWGYPSWWCRVTGALELVVAGLVAIAKVRDAGLLLGAAIILVAVGTVVRHRDFGHLLPLGGFAVALAVALSRV